MLDFSRLVTPPEHGDVLVEPDHARMRRLAIQNRQRIESYAFRLLDRELADCRAEARAILCNGCDGPVIMTGHQPEFIHAGVWAKHVVAHDVARSLAGKAINFVVDSDAPKSTSLEIPTVEADRLRWRGVPYAEVRAGVPYESLPAMDESRRRSFAAEIRATMGPLYERSCMPAYLDALGDASDWVDQMVAARQSIERGFDVEMHECRVGRVWFGPLLGEMLVHAEKFASCYNAALADYRKTHRVRSADRPIPDLETNADRVELPVWVYRLGEARRRFFVDRRGDRMTLLADREPFAEAPFDELSRWERARIALQEMSPCVFRPRALALTLWSRIVAGDLFIHGIGGAKYDRITDGIIRRYFEVEPPGMGCVSATMMLRGPTPRPGSIAQFVYRARDVRWNPQRHVAKNRATEALTEARRAAVDESRFLQHRNSRDGRRREVFDRIRSLNAELAGANRSAMNDADEALRRARSAAEATAEARRRDYFFALSSCGELRRLREKLAFEGESR